MDARAVTVGVFRVLLALTGFTGVDLEVSTSAR